MKSSNKKLYSVRKFSNGQQTLAEKKTLERMLSLKSEWMERLLSLT